MHINKMHSIKTLSKGCSSDRVLAGYVLSPDLNKLLSYVSACQLLCWRHALCIQGSVWGSGSAGTLCAICALATGNAAFWQVTCNMFYVTCDIFYYCSKLAKSYHVPAKARDHSYLPKYYQHLALSKVEHPCCLHMCVVPLLSTRWAHVCG